MDGVQSRECVRVIQDTNWTKRISINAIRIVPIRAFEVDVLLRMFVIVIQVTNLKMVPKMNVYQFAIFVKVATVQDPVNAHVGIIMKSRKLYKAQTYSKYVSRNAWTNASTGFVLKWTHARARKDTSLSKTVSMYANRSAIHRAATETVLNRMFVYATKAINSSMVNVKHTVIMSASTVSACIPISANAKKAMCSQLTRLMRAKRLVKIV